MRLTVFSLPANQVIIKKLLESLGFKNVDVVSNGRVREEISAEAKSAHSVSPFHLGSD